MLCAIGLGALVDAQITLGAGGQYAVFGGTSIINTGVSVITPRIATSPGNTITGFGIILGLGLAVNGGQDANNANAQAAATDLRTAYNALAGLPATTSLTGQILGPIISVLGPGVYNFAGPATLIGALTFGMMFQVLRLCTEHADKGYVSRWTRQTGVHLRHPGRD